MFKYLVKQSVLGFVYLLFALMIALCIAMLDKSLAWLAVILFVLNIALYCFIVGMFSFKTGQDSVKVKHANDVERRYIIQTGEDRKINRAEEYKTYKGFAIGAIVCAPMAIGLILQAIFDICGADFTTIGAITGVIYGLFLTPYRYFGADLSIYWIVYGAAVITLTCGIAYYLGARKSLKQFEKIEKVKTQIYGAKRG